MASSPSRCTILGPMPQVAEVQDQQDDWTGVTDPATRRRLQNRLNRRAQRRRKRAAAQNAHQGQISGECRRYPGGNASLVDPRTLGESSPGLDEVIDLHTGEPVFASAWATSRVLPPEKAFLVRVGPTFDAAATQASLNLIAEQAFSRSMSGLTQHSHLTSIIRANMFHALDSNAVALGLVNDWLTKGTVSKFNQRGPQLHSGDFGRCPVNLLPTELQRIVNHHPWVDLLPLPQMRDNILRALDRGLIGALHELCFDVFDVGGGAGVEDAALIVWGNPWDPADWEASETFLRKWGWLLDGCGEILVATNRWRRRRGLNAFRFS